MDQPAIVFEQQKAPQILITPEGQLFQLLDNKGLLLLIPLETHENHLQPPITDIPNQTQNNGPIQPGPMRGIEGDLVLPDEWDRELHSPE